MRITNSTGWSIVTIMGDWLIAQWQNSGRNCAYLRKRVALEQKIDHDPGNDLFTDDGGTWSWVASWAMLKLDTYSNPLINPNLDQMAKDLAKLKFNLNRTDESIHFL